MPIEIEVLDPKVETLLQPEPRPVEQQHDQPLRALQLPQKHANLVPAEHHRQPIRRARPDDRGTGPISILSTCLYRNHSPLSA